ncbi:MAG: glucose-1-phosphate adenylyltransferase, partial [Bifidobacteriaceae bacterium]|nr:glucose-1-phosphate adenylyltransferase [Bifidobacteriaceae bacterium]
MAALRVLSIVLAGGEGKRLMPLTRDRAKPAVPFGGIYRLIDFPLSNLVNSGYHQIVVLTQYKSHSLDRHIASTWNLSSLLHQYVAPVPAQQRKGKNWFLGSADAIYQSLNLLDDEHPDIVVVVGADHVYRMDFSQMVRQHVKSGAELTVAGIRQPIGLADQFGVLETDPAKPGFIKEFREKPAEPRGLEDDPGSILASMGNYVFNADALIDAVQQDAVKVSSRHDMGGDIVPAFVERGAAAFYDFKFNDVPGSTDRDRAYWRDVGTLDVYYEAHRDLISTVPVFNLYNWRWPLITGNAGLPPAKFTHAEPGRIGHATRSLVSP